MSARNHLVTTRAQREAILRLFLRHYYDDIGQDGCAWICTTRHFGRDKAYWRAYRQYRKRFQMAGIGSDLYLFGQPYETGERGMWIGIESDGYTHS